MSDQFLGQLSLVGFNFAPYGWAIAAGQLLPIQQYAALFSLLGTMYGGNGTSTFGLPNLQGNVALGFGQGPGLSFYTQGQLGGSQNVTLLATQTPNHNHTANGAAGRGKNTPVTNAFAESTAGAVYSPSTTTLTKMSPSALPPFNGASQPHNNMMSYQALNWIIALQGIFPSRG
jgi:microcystin-dependent protein